MTAPRPARLRPTDLLRVGSAGLRTRPLRVALSALGIAIGIAAMVAVVGISASSRAQLQRTLDTLGTNLLTAQATGSIVSAGPATLPPESVAMVARMAAVRSTSAVGALSAAVYRSDRIPASNTSGLSVQAAQLGLPDTIGLTMASGHWLTAATAQYPTVVLGDQAAKLLGISQAGGDRQVWLGGQAFTVVGILAPAPLAPELDTSALVGWEAATRHLGFSGAPSTIYVQAADHAVTEVRGVLAATINPRMPAEVAVSRPSEALAAQQAVDRTFTGLLLGLGGVALLVGGVGVANTMIISVLERRAEIGLRRALGATRGQIRWQFMAESQLLAALGGVGGGLLGAAVTAGYATSQGWPTAIAVWVPLCGLLATLAIGAAAGLYPAMRAARLAPTEALAS